MIIRHSAYYLLARGVPGLVNFAALAVYTRLLTTEQFGRFALALAIVGLVDVLLFQWLRLVLARNVPGRTKDLDAIVNPLLGLFLVTGGAVLAAGGFLLAIYADPATRALIGLVTALIVAQAFFQMDTTLASAQLQPGRYGRLLGAKSALSLLLGAWLAWTGWGAVAPLTGLLVAAVLAWLVFGARSWRRFLPRWPDAGLRREYARYGLPLVVTFALGWILTSSDRLLLAWLIDQEATGVYTVGYDLAQLTLGLALSIISTAAYPLVLHRMEREGPAAASRQLETNGDLLVSVALAGCALLIALAPVLIAVLVGAAFQEGALRITPWIALGAAIAGIKAFHFDLAFHLVRRTRVLMITGLAAAAVNIILNLLLIPSYGIMGAAWATVASFGLAAVLSARLGAKVFAMPSTFRLLARGGVVAGAAYVGASATAALGMSAFATLLVGGVAGLGSAVLTAIMLDVAGMRASLRARLMRLIRAER